VERNRPDGIFSIYINDQTMSAISYYTEGLKKLREELDYLKVCNASQKHLLILPKLGTKATCLKTQNTMLQRSTRMLEMRIAKLEEVHSNARLIDETNLDLSKVLVLL
jgi:transcription elongation factor GreA